MKKCAGFASFWATKSCEIFWSMSIFEYFNSLTADCKIASSCNIFFSKRIDSSYALSLQYWTDESSPNDNVPLDRKLVWKYYGQTWYAQILHGNHFLGKEWRTWNTLTFPCVATTATCKCDGMLTMSTRLAFVSWMRGERYSRASLHSE